MKAYAGDNKTLLAFNFDNKQRAANLAGFSIQAQPPGKPAYFLINDLLFSTPNQHAVDKAEPPTSSANSPFQKYRWTHFTGQYHQGLNPAVGAYKYTVTPRYFDNNGNMLALDGTLSTSVTIAVGPFKKGPLSLGFTRGYMQSQAFEHHFGMHAQLMPSGKALQFDTSAAAGTDSTGKSYTYADEYAWMGESARVLVFDVLNQVLNDPTLSLKVFAYDLNEPDVIGILLKLAAEGRIRVILDNASLHTNKAGTKPEDQFTALFNKQKKGKADILRGHFARFSHDKIFIVSKNGAPIRVLTGSTNFSITGLYVNANHVLVFDDATVAGKYSDVFEESWKDLSKANSAAAFAASAWRQRHSLRWWPALPKWSINFSPHSAADASKVLNGLVTRVNQETGAGVVNGNVMFAVMQLTGGSNNPVYDALNAIHRERVCLQLWHLGCSGGNLPVSTFEPARRSGDGQTQPDHAAATVRPGTESSGARNSRQVCGVWPEWKGSDGVLRLFQSCSWRREEQRRQSARDSRRGCGNCIRDRSAGPHRPLQLPRPLCKGESSPDRQTKCNDRQGIKTGRR